MQPWQGIRKREQGMQKGPRRYGGNSPKKIIAQSSCKRTGIKKEGTYHNKASHTVRSLGFISSISYSPVPAWRLRSRPRPRPNPDSSWLSLAGCCDEEAWLELPPRLASPPKLIGLSSRCWHAHIPRNVMMPALANWSPHQSKFEGTERV
jgi:hypothetical protein